MPQLVDLWIQLMETHARLDSRFAVRQDAGVMMARRFQSMLADPDARVLIAETDGTAIGFAVGHVDANLPFLPGRSFGFISDVFVREEYRRQGRARRMVEALRRWFRQRQVFSVQLHAAACNPDARAFWQKLGFTDYLVRMWSDP